MPSPDVRVLHVLDHSLPLQSGYAFRTISVLQSHRALGHETFHLTTPRHNAGDEGVEEVDGWAFHRTSRPSGRKLPVAGEILIARQLERRLDGLVRQLQPDLIYAHSPLTNGWPALRVARRHRLPVAYEVRALWEDAAVEHGTMRSRHLRFRAIRTLETMLIRRVDAVAVICQGLRDEVLARGLSEAKVTVVPNVVDLNRFAVQRRIRTELQQRLNLTGCTVLGFAGSFYRYEGLALLIEAMPPLIQRFPKLRLLLLGGGREKARLRERARQMSVESHVIFAGRVPHEDMPQYYDLVDAFVYPRLPSRLTDLVTPLKPLEAMAAGRLVVASDVGGHRELVEHNRTGFLFRAGDRGSLVACLRDVLDHPERWGEVQRAARAFVERYRSDEVMASCYRNMLDLLAPPHLG